MRRSVFRHWLLAIAAALLAVVATTSQVLPEVINPLVAVYLPRASQSLTPLGYDERLWGQGTAGDRSALIQAIDYSLQYLDTPAAVIAYQTVPTPEFTRDRVQRSLRRLRQLVLASSGPEALQQEILEEFAWFQSVGSDGEGSVTFTGYFEPLYLASRVPTSDYRYPLYRRPPDLDVWTQPQPTRLEIEGVDGLQGHQGPLKGLELVWLRDRLEAFLVQVQGSAKLLLPSGEVMSVTYAGRTDYPYTSIGRALVEDGIVAIDDLSLPVLIDYFRHHPEALDRYLPRNQRYIFFRETDGGAPLGTFSVPVTAGRSIATDKTIMPPAAPALIALPLPEPQPDGGWSDRWINRLVLNQDTGGAIQGPGRVDIFVGSGTAAGEQAGLIHTTGSLYFLLLKE